MFIHETNPTVIKVSSWEDENIEISIPRWASVEDRVHVFEVILKHQTFVWDVLKDYFREIISIEDFEELVE